MYYIVIPIGGKYLFSENITGDAVDACKRLKSVSHNVPTAMLMSVNLFNQVNKSDCTQIGVNS